jgi:glycine cleavage system H lipoate-binding protein
VTEVNTALATAPETVNADPHGTWIMAIELADAAGTSGLLDSAAYAELVK